MKTEAALLKNAFDRMIGDKIIYCSTGKDLNN